MSGGGSELGDGVTRSGADATPRPTGPTAMPRPTETDATPRPSEPGTTPDPDAVTTPDAPRAASAPAVPSRAAAAVEAPSPDVAPVEAESAIPGRHRGGFERWPTAPVGITPVTTAPDLDAPVLWAPAEPARPPRGVAAWALGFAIVALIVSFFVGWGFPLGLVAIVTAIIALRRPLESRGVAVWALVLAVVSVLYSAGWLMFAASRADLFALFR